jgi:hypothetical protein
MNIDVSKIIEEFEEMNIFKKGELTEKTTFGHVISGIDEKWDLLSAKEQSRVCFLLSSLSLRIQSAR